MFRHLALFIFILSSCNETYRKISSVNQMPETKLTAQIFSFSQNYEYITIRGQCSDGEVRFRSFGLDESKLETVECYHGNYSKALRLKKGLDGSYDIQVSNNDEISTLEIFHVDTTSPKKIWLRTPKKQYSYGDNIVFSGKCEHGALVYIRNIFLENNLITSKCSHGFFIIVTQLTIPKMKKGELDFVIYQVDNYGNYSKEINLKLGYRVDESEIILDEYIKAIDNAEELFVSGDCGNYENISIGGITQKCTNGRFKKIIDTKDFKYESLYSIAVQGVHGGLKSSVQHFFYYNRIVETSPKFFSPQGDYFKSEEDEIVISGTCGVNFGNTSVRLYTKKSGNIFVDEKGPVLSENGNFYVTRKKYDLDGETQIFAECKDDIIGFKTNHFSSEFKLIEKNSKGKRIEDRISINSRDISYEGNCFFDSLVVVKNTRTNKIFESDCIEGRYIFNILTTRNFGETRFEFYEKDPFTGTQTAKSLLTLQYNIQVQHNTAIRSEGFSPHWGSQMYPLRIYWDYPRPNRIEELYYGMYSRDSLIQVDWSKLPKGVRHLVIEPQMLIDQNYQECSNINIFFKAKDSGGQESAFVQSHPFRYDFTPPDEPILKSVDYSPLYKGDFPNFVFDSISDNCVDEKSLRYRIRIYEDKKKLSLIKEFYISNLYEMNKYKVKSVSNKVYRVGISIIDLAGNISEQYISIGFTWK